ncbi:retrovirus-related pol polyprotein from transposon TNT 1-94 [Tanacetum coccineum]
MQQSMQNPEDILDPTTGLDMALELMSKAFQLNNITPTNDNQRSSSNPCYRQIAQTGMNIDHDRQMLMVDDNVGNQLSVVPGIANRHGNGNVVAARAEGNSNGINGNQIRCYNCRGEGHYASICIVKPRKRDAAYLQTQLQIAQKEEAGIQLNSEEFDFMTAAGAYDEIEEVTANCTLKDNLQQASTSDTQTDNAPVYDSDGSAECGTVEQNPANVEETRAYFESLYNNLAIKVAKVNTINRKLRETNADLATELARYKIQEKCLEISQEKYDKLERCYQKSVYQEQCLTKKVNALHLSFGKQITTLNEEISNLNKQLLKEKLTVSSLLEEKKRLNSDFKIREDELLDKQIQLENKIKKLDNILVKTAKFVRDFQSLAKEADESLAKHKAMELEIERLLRAVASQDIMAIVQNNFVVDTSNLQTELERTKERFENCIIKKENEYAKLWNDWYKKCEECKYDKISYDKAYNDMQQKIERLQAQLGDKKGKSKDTPCVSNTLDPLSQKLENKNVELEFQLRAQLFDKVSERKKTNKGTSANTQFSKQSILGKPPSSSKPKLYSVTPFPKSTVIPKYVNGMKSRKKNQSANVSESENQRKHKPRVWKPKKVGSKERLASPKPSTPRYCLRWSPTGRMFDLKGKIIATSKSECQHDCSKGDNACTSNPQEPINKRFPCSTFSMTDMIVMTSMVELESLFGHLFDELSNGENQVVSKSPAVTTADAFDKRQ